jgi:glutaredoxin
MPSFPAFGHDEMDTMRSPLLLEFYTKKECPLCEAAYGALERVLASVPEIVVEVRRCDIEARSDWWETYRVLIPVLELEGERVALYRVHERQLKRRLQRAWKLRA